jgi:hypothetical protein
MKQEKDVLQSQELSEAKGGKPEGRVYCDEYYTCPYANPQCYYQQLPGGYMIPCIL